MFLTLGAIAGGGLAWLPVWAITLPTSWVLGACFDWLGFAHSSGAFLLSVGLAALAQTAALYAIGTKAAQHFHKKVESDNGIDEDP
jgi:hypothetical protein